MTKNTLIVLAVLILAEWSLRYRRRRAEQRQAEARALRERLDKLLKKPLEAEFVKPRRRRRMSR